MSGKSQNVPLVFHVSTQIGQVLPVKRIHQRLLNLLQRGFSVASTYPRQRWLKVPAAAPLTSEKYVVPFRKIECRVDERSNVVHGRDIVRSLLSYAIVIPSEAGFRKSSQPFSRSIAALLESHEFVGMNLENFLVRPHRKLVEQYAQWPSPACVRPPASCPRHTRPRNPRRQPRGQDAHPHSHPRRKPRLLHRRRAPAQPHYPSSVPKAPGYSTIRVL
jgi:hypothetical protein